MQLFRQLDSDDNGWLDIRELQRALKMGGFDYDLHTVQALMRLFSGRLANTSLNESQFTSMHMWLDDTMNRFSTALKPGETSLGHDAAKTALIDLLRGECGRLGMDPNHIAVDDQAFNAFLDTADPDSTGTIDGPEFVSGAVALKGLVSVFRAFDRDRDGVITMKFSQLLFAMAHVW